MTNIRTRAELAHYFSVSTKTLNRWLKKANIVLPKGYLTPAYVAYIIEKFENPNWIMSHFGA